MEELLQKVIAKVYQLNKNTKHDFFFNFSGHINRLDIDCYKDGWNENKNLESIMKFTTELTEENLEKVLKKLEEIEKGA